MTGAALAGTRAPKIVVLADRDLVIASAAARLITRLVDAQVEHGFAHVVLTGGGVGIATLAAVAASPARDAVDWAALDVWWGDERYLPSGDPERNETQARHALLDHVPLAPERIHAMPAADAGHADVEAAAAAYARDLAAASAEGASLPRFDVLMLGMGPDGHIASLFPERPGLAVRDADVIGVRESPKPPPERISLTVPVIQSAREVWLLVDGIGKSEALLRAVAGDPATPATCARGIEQTLWLVDAAAAGR